MSWLQRAEKPSISLAVLFPLAVRDLKAAQRDICEWGLSTAAPSPPARLSCHCIHLCVFIDQLYWTEFDSEHSVSISYESGHSLTRSEERFSSGCTFRTGSECLISSVVSSTSDPLSIILISFVSHLTPHLETLWVRYWLCYSFFIWDSSKNQTVNTKQKQEASP